LIVAGLEGCSSGNAATPDPNALPFVQCTIRSGGKDVEAAAVALHSKAGGKLQIVGRYDAEGACYRFTTKDGTKESAGVPEGSYLMTVVPGRGTKATVAGKYAKAQTSGVSVEVKPGENFLPPIELN
jgi:hypothetical protein